MTDDWQSLQEGADARRGAAGSLRQHVGVRREPARRAARLTGVKVLYRAVMVTALLAAAGAAWSAPAGACSCDAPAGPPPVLFEGRAVEMVGERDFIGDWTFDVTRMIRGDVAELPVARVATGGDNACGFGMPLVAGATYEVGGSIGELRRGESRLFVNTCGGSLRQLEAGPPLAEQPGFVEATQQDGPKPAWVWLWIGVLAVAAVGGGALAVGARHRRATAEPGG